MLCNTIPRQFRNVSTTKSIKINSKSTLLHALRTVGDGVANNLNDASHLPHLAELSLYYFVQVMNSQRGYHAVIILLSNYILYQFSGNKEIVYVWYMYVCMYMYVHTYMYLVVHAAVCVYMYTCTTLYQGDVLKNATFAFVQILNPSKICTAIPTCPCITMYYMCTVHTCSMCSTCVHTYLFIYTTVIYICGIYI
jgi:hypothetical protein